MIYTSYFANYKGENSVSVSRVTPKWYSGETCIDLAPPWELVEGYKNGTISEKEYRKKYIAKLKKLDVDFYAKLLEGKVLLCYEKSEDFCHRKILRQWFNRNGYLCGELKGKEEIFTCVKCRSSKNNGENWVCVRTGEILSRKKLMVHTCEDWRYFA